MKSTQTPRFLYRLAKTKGSSGMSLFGCATHQQWIEWMSIYRNWSRGLTE